MVETESGGGVVAAAEQSLPEKARGEQVEPKELGDSNRKIQLDDSDPKAEAEAEVEAGEAKRETLAKNQSDGALEKSVAAELNGEAGLKEKEKESCKEVEANLIPHVDGPVVEVPVESTSRPTSLTDPSTASAARGPLPVARPTAQKQRSLSLVVSNVSVSPVVKTPAHDGYNWRKYGQKQVKSPKGSRSYYRCTYSDCCAKKIECSNDSGDLIGVVNKGSHSHDPPRKSNSVKESRVVSSVPPVPVNSKAAEEPAKLFRGSDPSTSAKENIHKPLMILERKRCNSSVFEGNGKSESKENHLEEPEPKRRLKKENSSCHDSVSKPEKKHKYVVHAAGDVGISGDGYRWRKYGQKMVKGNPNPRNYYRCTSAGCPVRKHIETAVDSLTAVIITYKGVHDHDMPVPKKRHSLVNAPLMAVAAPTSMNGSQTRTELVQCQTTPSQCSVGREINVTSEAVDIGGEKAMESARTLLSIGFEIKQC